MSPDPIGTISYSGGAILFALFFLIALYSAFRQQTSWWLTLPALVSSASLAFVVQVNQQPTQFLAYLPLVELIRQGAWFVAILGILREASGSRIPRRLTLMVHAFWIGLFFFNLLLTPFNLRQENALHPMFVWNGLFLAILGLVVVEQLYRNTQLERQTKLISVAVGALFLYDLYLFAHALVFRNIDTDLWLARGAIQGASALVLALGVITFARDSDRISTLSISRPIVFYTTSLTMAGFFLALMAAGGYYIKVYGGNWGTVLQVTLIFSGCISIASVFVSRRLRVRLNVFIDKHFFNHKYDYRTEWLKLIKHLSQSSDSVDFHERAIHAMASIFKSPGGCIWLSNDQEAYWPIAAMNISLPDRKSLLEPANSTFCRALRDQEWVFSPDAPDSDQTSTLNEHLPEWVTSIPDLWIIIPLLNENDLTGFIGLCKPPGEAPLLNWEDLDLLKTVGRQISSYLTRHHAAELLAQSKQFDAYNKLTAFVMHDLKNLIAQQALVVKNAAKHKDNPAFIEDMINTIDNSVNRMNNLLQKLQQKDSLSGQNIGLYELDQIVSDAVAKCRDRYPMPSLNITAPKLRVQADQDHLEMVLIHIIKNAQEATTKEGFVEVSLTRSDNNAVIEIEDNGSGMDPDFITHRLFKPFDTTKSGKGMGVGVYQAREFLHSIGGKIDVESELGKGSTFRLIIPITQ